MTTEDYKEKLLIFCLNLEKYLGWDKSDGKSFNEIVTSESSSYATLGDKFRNALKRNGVPLMWEQNKDLIFSLIEIRNKFVHTGTFDKQSEMIIRLAINELPSLFITNNVKINRGDVDLLLSINKKTVEFLREAFKCNLEDVSAMCFALYRRKEFQSILPKAWDFVKIRNKFLHQTLSFTNKELESLKKFRSYINNKIEEWKTKNETN